MKDSLSKLLFMLLISFCVNCSAECDSSHAEIHFITCPKTYVIPDQIDFHENGIFVRIHDFIIQTESLSTDAKGIFFENIKSNGCGPSQWKCKRRLDRGMICETCNWTWNFTCSYCGKEKKEWE